MIVANGVEYRTLRDEMYVNGMKVLEAYANGVKVYPDESEDDGSDMARYFRIDAHFDWSGVVNGTDFGAISLNHYIIDLGPVDISVDISYYFKTRYPTHCDFASIAENVSSTGDKVVINNFDISFSDKFSHNWGDLVSVDFSSGEGVVVVDQGELVGVEAQDIKSMVHGKIGYQDGHIVMTSLVISGRFARCQLVHPGYSKHGVISISIPSYAGGGTLELEPSAIAPGYARLHAQRMAESNQTFIKVAYCYPYREELAESHFAGGASVSAGAFKISYIKKWEDITLYSSGVNLAEITADEYNAIQGNVTGQSHYAHVGYVEMM